jgi:hypothetical protein
MIYGNNKIELSLIFAVSKSIFIPPFFEINPYCFTYCTVPEQMVYVFNVYLKQITCGTFSNFLYLYSFSVGFQLVNNFEVFYTVNL